VELTELVRGAQDALDRGDYHLAARACTLALEAYPACMSAHRILGEALLERGETEQAIGHFDRALTLDPLGVVARLGLGVAAEEHKNPGLAYAHYLHAWEINPALDQVRGQLVRLRAALGSHDRLHPTRAGLAGIHARSGQLGRAASEWRAILAVDPESVRARTSLAEVLWRAGDDAGAVAICREILRTAPDNARALAMVADIEKRVEAPTTGEWVQRYRAIDPLGEVSDLLMELREGADLSFLAPASQSVPDFDFEAAAAEVPVPAAAATIAAPTAPSLAASHVAAPDLWDTLVRDLGQDPTDEDGAPAESLQPFSWSDDGSVIDLGPAIEPFSLAGLQELDEVPGGPSLPVMGAAAAAALMKAVHDEPAEPELDLTAMMEADPVVAAPVTVPPPVVPEPMFVAEPVETPSPAPAPAPVAAATATATAQAADPFVTSDGRVDLTIGWDDIDRQLQAATPTSDAAGGYEDLLAELDAGGLAPFAADDGSTMNGAWEPFSVDEVDAPLSPAAGMPATAEPEPVPALANELIDVAPAAMPWGMNDEPAIVPDDWVEIDDDLIAAIPSPQPSGYTELLRHVDIEEAPLIPDPTEVEVDPFANPDASGDPLGFEDLLTVTSRDGTSELGPVETDLAAIAFAPEESPDAVVDEVDAGVAAFAWTDEPLPVPTDETGVDAMVADLGEVEPFSLDDLVAGDEFGGEVGGFSDLEDVFAPASYATTAPERTGEPFAAVAPAETEFAADALAADAFAPEAIAPEAIASDAPPSEIPAIDWSEPFAQASEAPVAASAVEANGNYVDDGVRWPTFVGDTSDLIDRGSGGLFGRLRAAKTVLVAEGRLAIDRSVAPRPTPLPVAVENIDELVRQVAPRPRLAAVDGEPVAAPRAEPGGLDLTAMRVKLIESESAAAAIAETLETAIAAGDADPLALRVLGEAYLRLGRTEQAAAQFRQAMLARRRAR
jgi:tetratricopeptide (TPR) repeat protein